MNTNQNMEERLWNFIDGTVTANEKSAIEELLQNNYEWKAKYNDLLHFNNLLKSAELEEPSLRFSKNVMEKISKLHIAPATKSYINKKIIWGIGFFFIAMLIGFLIYGFGQITFTSGGETTLSKKLDMIDFSKFFNNTWVNVLMMINVVIGLFLLDNYLGSKRREYRKGI